MRSLTVPAVAALLTAGLPAGCGGSDSRLSASAYRGKLAAISREADAAQTQVVNGLGARSVKEIVARLTTYAAAERQISNEVTKLRPPKDAQAANAELAVGAQDTARETQAAAVRIGAFKTPQAAIAFLQSSLGSAKGGHELDAALARLKKLGYTNGS